MSAFRSTVGIHRTLVTAAVASMCALAGALVFPGAPAEAALTHNFLSALSAEITKGPPAGAKAGGGEEALTGPLSSTNSSAMTVAPGEKPGEQDHLWVSEANRVDEFNATNGEWESQLEHDGPVKEYGANGSGDNGIAVGGSTGEREVYVASKSDVAVFGPTGKFQGLWTGSDTPQGSFANSGASSPNNTESPAYVSGIAVDDSSSLTDWAKDYVYVSTRGPGGSGPGVVVDVFAPGKEAKEKYATQLTGYCPVAGTVVGAAGCNKEEIIPFTFSYGIREIAVQPATGDVVVNDGIAVYIFEPVGLQEYKYLRQVEPPPGNSFHQLNEVSVGGGEEDGEIYLAENHVVYQYNAQGVYTGSLTETPTGTFSEIKGLAVDPASGEVYVANISGETSAGIAVFTKDLVIPDLTTGGTSDVSPRSATLDGTVNPLGEGPATCQFEWGTTSGLGQSVSCAAAVEGNKPIAVHSEAITGLQPDTTYYYRLEATNKNGTNTGKGSTAECEGKPSPVACFTTLGAVVETEGVYNVASTSANPYAEIEPNNSPTSYYFQYGEEDCATAAHECATAPAPPPGASVGSGKGPQIVHPHLQGLAASTTYHYRVVVISELLVEIAPGKYETKIETIYGPDQTFTTEAAGSGLKLPDNRAWEMVSPPDKEGALIQGLGAEEDFGEGEVAQAAAGGDAVSYVATAPTEADPEGNTAFTQDLSWRGPDGGWSTKDITPPNDHSTGAPVGAGNNYRFFSSDLSLGIVEPFGGYTPLSPEASGPTDYLRTDFLGGNVDDPCVSGCYRPLITEKPGYADVPPGADPPGGYCLVCVAEVTNVTPDFSHLVMGGTEWSAGKPPSEELQPLGVLPLSEGGGQVGFSLSPAEIAHQLSDDGSVFFTHSTGESSHLYLQDVEKDESVRLDVAQGVAEPKEGDAEFLYASSDGSRVLFSDSGQLTKAAGGGIYECRIAEVKGALSCGELELTGISGGELIGGSEDASYLYIEGASGKLYVDHYSGSGWIQTEVASVSDGFAVSPRVSPNGQWLAFMSYQELTGYNNRDVNSGQSDAEIYLYNAPANRLVCASCNPTGARPIGEFVGGTGGESGYLAGYGNEAGGHQWLSAAIPPRTHYTLDVAFHQPRFLSDSGRLFFNSHEALVPQDDNGTWDVYEYEPPGVGDCTTTSATFGERSGGCVGLISSGTSAEESEFVEASENGSDVFFITAAKLAPQDTDTSLDVYDAHECTEQSPCPAVPTTPPPCDTGDACKPAPTPQPTFYGAPSSETFSGAGNITPESSPATVTSKGITRAHKLEKALKACRGKPKKRRAACVKQARRMYGSAARAKKSHKGGK